MAVDNLDAFWFRSRKEAAMPACLAAGPKCSTLQAIDEPRAPLPALVMDVILGRPIGIERPFDWIFREPVGKAGAGVIDDDRVGLAIDGSKHPAEHLSIETDLLR